jgi:hypothetical protein
MITRNLEKTFEHMLNTIGDSLIDLASANNEEDAEDQEDGEEAMVQRLVSNDDESDWVMGTISKMVQQHRQRFRQRQMKLDELT